MALGILRVLKANRTARAALLVSLGIALLYAALALSTSSARAPHLLESVSAFLHSPINGASPNATTSAPPPKPTIYDPKLILGETHNTEYAGPPVGFNGTRRANATLLMLARNNELEKAKQSVRELEEKFNRQFGYPWLFLNNVPFDKQFKE